VPFHEVSNPVSAFRQEEISDCTTHVAFITSPLDRNFFSRAEVRSRENLLRSFPHGEKICASMPIRHNFSALIKATAPEAFQEFVLK
jgi:hypothetical protein